MSQLSTTQRMGLGSGILAFGLLAFLDTPLRHDPEFGARPALAAAVAAMMAIWWLTEALPIYATACVPLLAYPLLRVLGPSVAENARGTLSAYLDPYIFLFAGGMGIAAAMQRWDLHRRIALGIMATIGTEPKRLLAGCLVATAAISLWISNTATAAMMLPIGLALMAQIEARHGGRRLQHFGMALMLAIAYGANVGGIGTKIGTAPNAQFAGFAERIGIEISFLQFLAVGFPFVVMFLPIVFVALWRMARRDEIEGVPTSVIHDELARLGPRKREESIVFAVFVVTALLWIFGKPLREALAPILESRFEPWKLTSAHFEGGIAVLAALSLMLWRSRGKALLSLGALRTVPWETLLLLGGGFAMAAGIQVSGLSKTMGAQLLGLQGLPPLAQVVLASLATVALSAVASNTATIAVMLVVLHQAVAAQHLPTVLFAATIASSCDFALPVGTPPNAIVFGSGYVSIPRMARTGVVLDLIAALVAALWCGVIVRWVL